MSRSPLLVIASLFVAYLLLGACSLSMQQETVKGDQGVIWSATQRALELLPRLEKQVTVYLSDRQDLIAKIVSGRQELQKAYDTRDMQKLNQAQQGLDITLKAVAEAYPQTDLSEVQRGLMDETAGSVNRINTARLHLIEDQVSFNKSRIVFFPLQVVFPRMGVLGEDYDPTTPLPTSNFGDKQ